MHDLLEQYILKNNIFYHYNIVPGHTKVKVDWKKTMFTAFLRHTVFQKVEYYFFYFDRLKIALYQYQDCCFFGDVVFIPWHEISHFQYKKGFLEVKISFVFKNEKFEMMLSRKMRGEDWVSENMKYLLENQFFYNG